MSWKFPDYPRDWDNTRKSVYARAGHRCERCGSSDRLHAHHKVSLSKGGSNSSYNLEALCEDCHAKRHPHMKSSGLKYDQQSINQAMGEIEKEHQDFAKGIMLLFLIIFLIAMGGAFLGSYISP